MTTQVLSELELAGLSRKVEIILCLRDLADPLLRAHEDFSEGRDLYGAYEVLCMEFDGFRSPDESRNAFLWLDDMQASNLSVVAERLSDVVGRRGYTGTVEAHLRHPGWPALVVASQTALAALIAPGRG